MIHCDEALKNMIDINQISSSQFAFNKQTLNSKGELQVIFVKPDTVHSIIFETNATPKIVKNQGRNLILYPVLLTFTSFLRKSNFTSLRRFCSSGDRGQGSSGIATFQSKNGITLLSDQGVLSHKRQMWHFYTPCKVILRIFFSTPGVQRQLLWPSALLLPFEIRKNSSSINYCRRLNTQANSP